MQDMTAHVPVPKCCDHLLPDRQSGILGHTTGDVQAVQRSRTIVPMLKGFLRILLRFEKLDVIFLGLIVFVLIFNARHQR